MTDEFTCKSPLTLDDWAQQAQDAPARSLQRQHALTQLVAELERYLGLHDRPLSDREAEAWQDTCLYLFQNIDRYDRDRKVLHWMRTIFKYRKLDRWRSQFKTDSIDALIEAKGWVRFEKIQQDGDRKTEQMAAIEHIRDDPENLYQTTYYRNDPDANFRQIALLRFEGYAWKEIAETLNYPLGGLSTFYQRCCQRFASRFRDYLN